MSRIDTTKRAVIYARQSLTPRDEVDDSLSIASQVRACADYIGRQGWVHVGTYEDPDQRGWKVSRPAFDQMLQRMRAGGADVVVVFKLSRFMRSLVDQERFVAEIADAGGELASVSEPYINTSPLVRQILGAVNEQHKRDMGDFLRAAWAERARRGLHHGGAPYGYRMVDGHLEIDDATAPIVREIFAWALAGKGSPEITEHLVDRGIRTSRSGTDWTPRQVLSLLRRPVYCGRITLNGELVSDSGTHEPLVDPETFDAVQANLDRRSFRRRKTAPSWIDGFAEHACGSRMYANFQRTWRYRCGLTHPSNKLAVRRCHARPGSMIAAKIEHVFGSLLVDALQDMPDIETVAARIETRYAEGASDRDRRRREITRRIADLKHQRERLLDLVLAGHVDDAMYSDRDGALKAQLAHLQAELASVPGPVDVCEVARRHAAIHDAAMALPIVLGHAPAELPGLLHALDVRVVIGDGPPRLRFGQDTAPFIGA